MDKQERKVKLTVEEQIEDMRKKNVKFEIFTEQEAKSFLQYNNYYFKIKSYARNYNMNPQNKTYYNLDFAYLVELSKLDVYIRRIILELSLDVEHYLKVSLMNDLNGNSDENGYNVVELFLQHHPNAASDILQKANKYSFCSDLVEKHINESNEIEELALWNIVELLSFGNFMELYQLYYQLYPSFNYSTYLKSVKFIRNAAAHNNCILSSIKKPNSVKKFSKTRELSTRMGRIPELRNIDNLDGMMKNPIIHDFVTLLFVYNDIMKKTSTKQIRTKRMHEIKQQFCDEDGRFKQNGDYFKTNPYLVDAYKFICHIINYIDKKNQNPKHRNYL